MRALALVCLLVMATPALAAPSLELNGKLIQGALVVGRTVPGSKVAVNGKPVRVSADGRFLIGLGRDAPPTVKVQIGTAKPQIFKVARRNYKIQRINGLAKRKVTPNPQDIRRIIADNASISKVRAYNTAKPYFESGFVWPLRGRFSGLFGSLRILNGKPKNPHNGVDIAAPIGTPIRAPADGVVVLVARDMFYTGETLMIDHGYGLTSVYAHMSKIVVNQGQTVSKGDIIGMVGMSGRATGPHLHWGISLFSTHLDPALAVGKM